MLKPIMVSTYTQAWDAMANAPSTTLIVRDVDGAFIPFDPDNLDYQAYQVWLAKGNTPTLYSPPGAAKQPSRQPPTKER
jgi:hypothetical protein